MKTKNFYQYALIFFAGLVVIGIGLFVYQELFPEYKKYQNVYVELEKFRSTYTGEAPAPFQKGIKQILINNPSGGPETIDRCTSCHVAIDLPHFSPTSPDYIWNRVDDSFKTMQVDGKPVNLEKVLQMHPLMPGETRPFQFHPLDQYGCSSCHSGNGRSLVAERAHGPVYDGSYKPFYSSHKPQFTEVDPDHDPTFSRMYNDKPSHDLIFQTTPILAGPLIAANCVQCHQPTKSQVVDQMTPTYVQGKELFVSQGCYSCHRISGYSRASVGPELTQEGNSYPWYVKESIVWPQADLPSSSMPNFRLDHEEIAALMTFLMAQKGNNKAVSEMDYTIHLSEWEKGAKLPWEEPVNPIAIRDTREGQMIFASEGCASCHKLRGFTTNAVNTDRPWFREEFPEQLSGSQLVQKMVDLSEEIDARIHIDSKRQGMIEEIDAHHPGLIESFYTPFKYAARVLDHENQERLHRALLAFIEEYGLGRDIAPHLHWSGLYRDDAWLLGHFRNPNAYTARSIMPALPFDDSKFYMLSHLLHQFGQKNQEALQEVCQEQGFNPALAYEQLCSSCHGGQRQGNGVIAEWIYPIPKNLRDPTFLTHLTKEKAVESVLHGVPGTPMPPWGKGVLTTSQAEQLVDWLYQGIPYDPRKVASDAKWRYMPEDIVAEMKKEKSFLLPKPNDELSYFIEKSPGALFIREAFYTSDNLEAGQQLFGLNCASCHGNDGTGTGPRATSMVEAKPRMLTNLPWIQTRDDLRLLRSIKYGVPGTAMTPWGDQTTAAQRMQLVLYIRNLTRSGCWRTKLEEILYNRFDVAIQKVYANYREGEDYQTQIAAIKSKKELYAAFGEQAISSGFSDEVIQTLLMLIEGKGSSKAFSDLLDKKVEEARDEAEKKLYTNFKAKWEDKYVQ